MLIFSQKINMYGHADFSLKKINIDGNADFFSKKINIDCLSDFFIKKLTWFAMLIFPQKINMDSHTDFFSIKNMDGHASFPLKTQHGWQCRFFLENFT